VIQFPLIRGRKKVRLRGKRGIRQSAQPAQVTILLAEDNDTLRDLLSRFLRRQGYAVRTARNGAAAWKILTAEEIHVLILDLQMPKLDGVTILQRLRKRSGQYPYVIVTSAVDREAADRMIRGLGVEEYLPKPFHLAHLLDRVVLFENRLRRGEWPGRSAD
jgi:DNA-binding response OmpR family regulator